MLENKAPSVAMLDIAVERQIAVSEGFTLT